MEKGVFEPVSKAEAANNSLFGCLFVDTRKKEGNPDAYAKLRLVVQGFNDKKHDLMTHETTVQRSSQRLLLALAMILPR